MHASILTTVAVQQAHPADAAARRARSARF